MNNVLALIDLHISSTNDVLTNSRELASTTFLGRYAFIDFVLSNLINSGIDDISILVQKYYRSITKHLGPSSTYLKNTKTGFLNILINEKELANPLFNTDVRNLLENDYVLYDSTCNYVLICPVNFIYKIDYQKVIEQHINSGKEISVIYKNVKDADNYLDCDKIVIDSLNSVQKFDKVTSKDKEANVSLKTYVVNMDYLKNVILKSNNVSQLFNLDDVFKYLSQYDQKMNCIEHKGYARVIRNLKDYYKYSLEILDGDEGSSEVFSSDSFFLTKTHNSRPVLYGKNADVTQCIIANGCTINGKAKHSILARDVIIEEGATVEDSILFTHTIVRKGVHLKGVVADKRCEFKTKKEVIGTSENPLYINRGAKI